MIGMVASAATARAYPAIRQFLNSVPHSDTDPIPQEKLVPMFEELRRREGRVRRNGNGKHIAHIEDRIYRANMRMVVCEVNHFAWVGEAWISDLIQEGSTALVAAIRKYPPGTAYPFYAYARRCIRNRLSNYFRDHVRKFCAINTRTEGDADQNHKRPCAPLVSTDIQSFDGTTMGDNLSSPPEEYFVDAFTKSEVADEVKSLPPRLRRVIKMRFMTGMTLPEIGRKMHLTKQRIYQLEQGALAILRTSFRAMAPEDF